MSAYSLTIPASLFGQMRSYVEKEFPLEACGLLGGRNGEVMLVITVRNAAGSPVRFRMDPAEQLKAFEQLESSGCEILAIFHSHPHGPAISSSTDMVEAAYPVIQVIWSLADQGWLARGFWFEDGHAAEVPLVVVGV